MAYSANLNCMVNNIIPFKTTEIGTNEIFLSILFSTVIALEIVLFNKCKAIL